jgi:hypothetical protein
MFEGNNMRIIITLKKPTPESPWSPPLPQRGRAGSGRAHRSAHSVRHPYTAGSALVCRVLAAWVPTRAPSQGGDPRPAPQAAPCLPRAAAELRDGLWSARQQTPVLCRGRLWSARRWAQRQRTTRRTRRAGRLLPLVSSESRRSQGETIARGPASRLGRRPARQGPRGSRSVERRRRAVDRRYLPSATPRRRCRAPGFPRGRRSSHAGTGLGG